MFPLLLANRVWAIATCNVPSIAANYAARPLSTPCRHRGKERIGYARLRSKAPFSRLYLRGAARLGL